MFILQEQVSAAETVGAAGKELTMLYTIPENKKIRVIVDTDAKNEVDDQFAIVHALLTPSFDLRGLIAAHFGQEKSARSMQDSREEIDRLLGMMHPASPVSVRNGAPHALQDEKTPVPPDGARLIISEALSDDPRPLYIAFLGPLTDMASALLMEPAIAQRNVTVIWIGGRDWPKGGWEYNLKNDVHAANVVFGSEITVWQVPRNVYRMMPVTFAELEARVFPQGELGRYLAKNVWEFNNAAASRPTEYRILGDSPTIGLMLFDGCGAYTMQPAPRLNDDLTYDHTGANREIRVYQTIDARFILEDFYAKLHQAYTAGVTI